MIYRSFIAEAWQHQASSGSTYITLPKRRPRHEACQTRRSTHPRLAVAEHLGFADAPALGILALGGPAENVGGHRALGQGHIGHQTPSSGSSAPPSPPHAGPHALLRPDDRGRVELAHLLLFGRPATPKESDEGLQYLEQMSCLVPGPAAAPEEIPKQRDMLVATAHEDPVAWRYTFQAPAADWFDTPFKDSTWDEGSAGFAPKKIMREPAFVVRAVWDTPAEPHAVPPSARWRADR